MLRHGCHLFLENEFTIQTRKALQYRQTFTPDTQEESQRFITTTPIRQTCEVYDEAFRDHKPLTKIQNE